MFETGISSIVVIDRGFRVILRPTPRARPSPTHTGFFSYRLRLLFSLFIGRYTPRPRRVPPPNFLNFLQPKDSDCSAPTTVGISRDGRRESD